MYTINTFHSLDIYAVNTYDSLDVYSTYTFHSLAMYTLNTFNLLDTHTNCWHDSGYLHQAVSLVLTCTPVVIGS